MGKPEVDERNRTKLLTVDPFPLFGSLRPGPHSYGQGVTEMEPDISGGDADHDWR